MKITTILLAFLSAFACPPIQAQGAPDLSKGADVIVQNYLMELEIRSPSKASTHTSVQYEVLNSKGAEKISFVEFCDSYRDLTKFSMEIKDASGALLASYDSNDLEESSYVPGYSLFQDSRIKFIDALEPKAYPYTVSIDYETSYKSTFYLPDFRPLDSWGMAIRKAQFVLRDHQAEGIMHRMVNWSEEVKPLEDGGFTVTMRDVPAIEWEPKAPTLFQIAPYMEITPAQFKMDHTAGSFSSWTAFGDWISELNTGHRSVSKSTEQALLDRISDAKTDYEKAKRTYEFLQENTRYVSIQMGIGGFKPFSPAEVERVGYGDCKALSNYMVTLLGIAGLEANYSLVYSGRNSRRTVPSFPANNFNHVIVCLPLDGDTVWLECTSQILPFNYLSPSTSDRYALAIENSSSKLVRTPKVSDAPSLLRSEIHCEIDKHGDAHLQVTSLGTGAFFPEYCYLAQSSGVQQKEWVEDRYTSDEEAAERAIFSQDGLLGSATVAFEHPKGLIKAGQLGFLGRRIVKEELDLKPLKSGTERKLPIVIAQDEVFEEAWTIQAPPKYKFSRLPENVAVINDMGAFNLEIKTEEESVECTIQLKLKSGTYPPERVEDFNALVTPWDKFKGSKWVFEMEGKEK